MSFGSSGRATAANSCRLLPLRWKQLAGRFHVISLSFLRLILQCAPRRSCRESPSHLRHGGVLAHLSHDTFAAIGRLLGDLDRFDQMLGFRHGQFHPDAQSAVGSFVESHRRVFEFEIDDAGPGRVLSDGHDFGLHRFGQQVRLVLLRHARESRNGRFFVACP